MNNKPSIKFYGGVGNVTGANFLLQVCGKKIMVDCGLVQGSNFADDENRGEFPYDPKEIDFLLITHAHIDHIGRVPRLVSKGFKGKIYSTPETLAISKLMFEDALKLIEDETRRRGTLPLYEQKDVINALNLWDTINYHESFTLAPDVSVYLKDAGHILGSTMYEITFRHESGEDRKIVFTGDLGNTPTPILRDTEKITDADYIVMESVYGDRNHDDPSSRRKKLGEIITEAVKRKGTLIIPVFSLEKTQVLLYEFHELEEAHQIPIVPVFLDSPLAIEVTKVYQAMRQDWNKEAMAERDIFKFPRLKYTQHSEESKTIYKVAGPKIIMAGSGMSQGGRILHHEINYLPSPENTILFVGYQVAGSLGRQIQDGAKEVTINGQKVAVKAKVETISGYSSHKDSDHLVEFVSFNEKKLKKVFVVMGEPKSALFLVQRLRDYLGVDATHPEQGEEFDLN